MGYIKVRFFVEKRNKSGGIRRYWQPHPVKKYKDIGFLPRRLDNAENPAKAIEQANKFNEELDAFLAGKIGAPVAHTRGSIEWLTAIYRKDARFKDLSPRSKDEYERTLATIEKAFKGIPVKSVTRGMASETYSEFHDTPRKAQEVVKIARILWKIALEHGAVESNVFAQMSVKGIPPREIIWEDAEIEAFIKTAMAKNRKCMALACIMAAYIGPNTGDVRLMPWTAYNGSQIRFKRRKTGMPVIIPLDDLQRLKTAIDATPRVSTQMIVNATTGKPYPRNTFDNVFREVADAAGVPRHKQFKDLRRTAVIKLAEAGATPQEIAAITGWKIDYCLKIINTYCHATLPMAKNALAKRRIMEEKKNG